LYEEELSDIFLSATWVKILLYSSYSCFQRNNRLKDVQLINKEKYCNTDKETKREETQVPDMIEEVIR